MDPWRLLVTVDRKNNCDADRCVANRIFARRFSYPLTPGPARLLKSRPASKCFRSSMNTGPVSHAVQRVFDRHRVDNLVEQSEAHILI